MKEKDFISIIKQTLNSKYIGDDCAYLKEFGLVVSQDSLVEDVHFSTKFITPYQLGYKSVMVNISDIAASGAIPKFLTISLSLPKDIQTDFVRNFYNGAKFACNNDIEIVGGDITGSDKIYISVCALGSTKNQNISSRKYAKEGYKIIAKGLHGSSNFGLNLLQNNKNTPEKFIKAHLMPEAQVEFGTLIGKNIKENYAMMDTSDGLMDALSTIANESNVLLEVDFEKIPFDKDLISYKNFENYVLFGGEDYGIISVIPKHYENFGGQVIGEVKQGLGVNLKIDNKVLHYTKEEVEDRIFNHFKG